MTDGPRRTWAPFVGAALAALTAGSLVVFSLIAQRTSLDGFPELRIATPADGSGERPASITVAPVADTGEPATNEVALGQPVTDPLVLIPSASPATPSAPLEVASLDAVDSPLEALGSRRPQRTDRFSFDGRFRADGELLHARRDGGSFSEDAQAGDSRHGGKHTHKSHEAKSKKGKKSKKAKKQKRENHGATHRRSRGRAHSHGSQGGSHATAPSTSRSSGSQGKSRQSAAPRPQPSPQGPPAHSNAGGNGKSNGKGHKKH